MLSDTYKVPPAVGPRGAVLGARTVSGPEEVEGKVHKLSTHELHPLPWAGGDILYMKSRVQRRTHKYL